MAPGKPRLPSQITLPFGFKVRVLYRTEAQLAQAGLPRVAGAWVASSRTIYVKREDHVAEKVLTIGHELQHVLVDYLHWLDQCIALPLCAESARTAQDLREDEDD